MNRTRLSIGYEPDFAPLTFRDGDQCRGMAIEILDEVLRRIGVAADFVPVALADHDAAIRARRIDAVAFKALTPERADDYDFSQPMATTGAAWFVARTGGVDGDTPTPGSRLATPTAGPLIVRLKRDYPEVTFIPAETYSDALSAVANGDADRAALNLHMGIYLANRDFPGRFELPATPFLETPIHFAVVKGAWPRMLEEFDRALGELRSAGVITVIEKRWLER